MNCVTQPIAHDVSNIDISNIKLNGITSHNNLIGFVSHKGVHVSSNLNFNPQLVYSTGNDIYGCVFDGTFFWITGQNKRQSDDCNLFQIELDHSQYNLPINIKTTIKPINILYYGNFFYIIGNDLSQSTCTMYKIDKFDKTSTMSYSYNIGIKNSEIIKCFAVINDSNVAIISSDGIYISPIINPNPKNIYISENLNGCVYASGYLWVIENNNVLKFSVIYPYNHSTIECDNALINIASDNIYIWVCSSNKIQNINIFNSSINSININISPNNIFSDGTYVWVTNI